MAPDLPRSSDLVRYARSPVSLLNQLADKAKAEAGDGIGLRQRAASTSAFTMDDEPPEVKDPERPPLVVGRPLPQLTVPPDEPRQEPRQSPDAMTLTGHLMELRRRVIVCVIALTVTGTLGFIFYPHLLSFMQHPYCVAYPKHCSFYVQAPLDGLTLRVKLATFGGLILASPIVLWEFWRFITPGLKPTEKRYAIPFIISTITLFLAGCALAYFSYAHALKFLITIGGPSLNYIISPNQYLSLMLLLMVMYGVAFIFPVLLVSLELAGVVNPPSCSSGGDPRSSSSPSSRRSSPRRATRSRCCCS